VRHSLSQAVGDHLDYRHGISAALNNLAIIARKLDDLKRASTLASESLVLKRETGSLSRIMHALLEIGAIHIAAWGNNFPGQASSG
jgi:hypothetical protein